MRFSTVIVGAFAAFASAQSSSNIASSTSSVSAPAGTPSADPAQAAILACLGKCALDDVNCKAKCVPVPHPTFEEVEKTNQCVNKCDKGNGTETDNTKYGNCVAGCIGQNYYSTGPAAAAATGGSGSGQTGAGGSSSGGANPTSAGGSPSGTAGGANNTGAPKSGAQSLQIGASAIALLGFLATFANL